MIFSQGPVMSEWVSDTGENRSLWRKRVNMIYRVNRRSPEVDASSHPKVIKSLLPKRWKIETFQDESGFLLKKVNVECVQLGHFETDYSFLLQRLQVDNCNFEMGHWLFDGMVLVVNWDVLRMITASYWIVANFPNQTISLFHSPLLSMTSSS